MPAPNTHTLHRKSKNTTPIFARTPPNCEPKLLQKRCFSGMVYRTFGTPKNQAKPRPPANPRPPASPTKAYKSTRYTHTQATVSLKEHHFVRCQHPTHTRSTASLKKRQKTPRLFLPEHHLTVSRNCSKNAAFPGWCTVPLEPLKTKQHLGHQPTLGLQPALQKHTKAPDTHTQATVSLKEHHFVKCQHPTHTRSTASLKKRQKRASTQHTHDRKPERTPLH